MRLLTYYGLILSCCCSLDLLEGKEILRNKRSDHDDEEESHHEDHTELINSLFHNYDSSSSPTHGMEEPTVISVNLQLISLDDISDSKMELVIDSRITFMWEDLRLMTPECRDEQEDCDDHFDLKKRVDQMWTPDLYILNSRLAKYHDQPLKNGMVYLIATGKVFLSKRLTLTLRCPMDLVYYPLDTQNCPLLICPYSLPEEELVLQWTEKGIGILEFLQDGQNKFQLQMPILTDKMRLKYEGPDITGSFSCVNATFSLRRRNGYHMGYSYTLTSFIVAVSWVGFWLPVSAVPARITLGVTTLLTLLTTANFVRASLPPISYVTAIDVWVGVCTFFVFLALLLFPISYHLSTKKETHRVHCAQKSQLHSPSDKCPLCRGRKIVSRSPEVKQSNIDLDRRCRIIFPGIFVIFNVAYWSYYLT